MNIKKLSKEAYETVKGYFPFRKEEAIERVALSLGEVGEALGHIKKCGSMAWAYNIDPWGSIRTDNPEDITEGVYNRYLDKTVEMELADAVLRLLSLIGGSFDSGEHINIKKKSALHTIACQEVMLCDDVYQLFCALAGYYSRIPRHNTVNYELITIPIVMIEVWCEKMGINLHWFISVKMRINRGRTWDI